MSEMERHKADKEIEAAKARLKRFAKKASECTNYHDPERLKRSREGGQAEPHGVTWRELGRRYRVL